MKDLFKEVGISAEPPNKGDVLVIRSKKSGDKKILVKVKDIINQDGQLEIILNKSTNSFFNWSMYFQRESWVTHVWNLGDVTITSSTNNTNCLIDL